VIERFNATTPDIRVELETYPFRQLFEVIEIRMSGQSRDFDIVSVDVPLVASYSARGFLHPLDEYFTPEEIEATWIPAATAAGSYGEQLHGRAPEQLDRSSSTSTGGCSRSRRRHRRRC
jgi:ABC-type glycerol-3-phosphate transport system substrate-binding protein